MRGAIVLLVSALVLSGCAGKAPETSAPQPEPEAFQDIAVTESTGAIRGIVVSESIVPIANATVKLVSTGLSRTTDAQGAFVFEGLEPGTYFLGVRKLGYLDTQASADVVAGLKEPPVLKVQLIVDAKGTPYTTLEQWDGFLQCGFTVVVLGVNACGQIDGRFINDFDLSVLPRFVQAEMVWESTQTLSPDLNLGFYKGGVTNWNSVEGPTPLVTNTTGDEIVEQRGNESKVLPMRVFPPYTLPVGLTLNQPFTVYVTMFFGFQPRADWRFVNEGNCASPDQCS